MRCEDLGVSSSDRLFSPSAERNKGPISEVLSQVLPDRGVVLEVGSGSGQHVVQFARAMPKLVWQPSERDADCLRSITAWLAVEALSNVRPPLHLDVNALPWPVESAAALVCINMVHITPWSAARACFWRQIIVERRRPSVSTDLSRGMAGIPRRATGILMRSYAARTPNGAFAISLTSLALLM